MSCCKCHNTFSVETLKTNKDGDVSFSLNVSTFDECLCDCHEVCEGCEDCK